MLTTQLTLHKKRISATEATVALPQLAYAGTTHQVAIQGFKFVPDNLAVAVGDTIIFTNEDSAPHTATAKGRSWDTGRLNRGQSGEVQVVAGMEGGYFFCNFHRNMKGQLSL